jgi:hypothetical protein
MTANETGANGGSLPTEVPATKSEQNRRSQIELAQSLSQKAPDLSVACRPAIVPEQLDETKS